MLTILILGHLEKWTALYWAGQLTVEIDFRPTLINRILSIYHGNTILVQGISLQEHSPTIRAGLSQFRFLHLMWRTKRLPISLAEIATEFPIIIAWI
jgi:hypothetical protein